MIREVTAGKIMWPGAPLLDWLVSALRRQKPTMVIQEEFDVFDRMKAQLEAIHELRVWRAARDMAPEPQGCPPQPRLIRQVLSLEEETHTKRCAYCQLVLKRAKRSWLTLQFEKLEQRWLRFKETAASFHIRAVQASILMILIATFLIPLRMNTQRVLSDMKIEVDRANTYAAEIAVLQQDRDRLMSNLAQLHNVISTLDKRSEQSQAEQRVLAHRLSLATKELNALQFKHQELLLGNPRDSSLARVSDGVHILQAQSSNSCVNCGVQPMLGRKR